MVSEIQDPNPTERNSDSISGRLCSLGGIAVKKYIDESSDIESFKGSNPHASCISSIRVYHGGVIALVSWWG
ncbi:hypothetical protein DASC09_032580 [Saccharomycopsis crataegensis]|uniref:Uncharacterized protein n=1 Tax=Saccharomycopsis crataegensis TaxID=43959 RepID=A0AAV5QMC9_9ASCO|nr:hypothetical protein DASC09_032580 [Saccharomycopsis crataegensis]